MNITQLWRYPVKSLGGERLESSPVSPGGIRFDRQYMIVDGDQHRHGKALTARLVAKLLAFKAVAADGQVRVKTPGGEMLSCDGDFAQYLQRTIERPLWIEALAPQGTPFHDAHDILVVNVASLRSLEQEWGKMLNPLRFRPNILIEGDDAPPYIENGWVGRRFKAGDVVFEGAALDERCVLTTIDPDTQVTDPSLLRLIVERHNQCFGLYCRVLSPGNIAVGDEWIALD
jgi:uncharacterized protein YcbX